MEWQVIVAIAFGIPIVIFPVVFVWYIVIGGIIAAVRNPVEKTFVKKIRENLLVPVVRNADKEFEKALTNNIERHLERRPAGLSERRI